MRDIYYVKPVDNSRLVPSIHPRASRQYFGILSLAAFAFGIVLFSAWQRFDGVEDGYRLEALQGQKQQLLEANRKLRLEEAFLDDPVRIDTIARNELGMISLAADQIVAGDPAPLVNDSSVLAQARSTTGGMPSQVKSVAAAIP